MFSKQLNGKCEIMKVFRFIVLCSVFIAVVTEASELTLDGRWSSEKAKQWYKDQP